MVSQKIIFVLVFWKLFLKVGAKHVKYKNYYLKTSFKFNFFKIVFILFWQKKQKKTKQNKTNKQTKSSYQSGPKEKKNSCIFATNMFG